MIGEPNKTEGRSVVIVTDKQTGEVNPYTSIKAFVAHAQGYDDLEKLRTRLYNRLSRKKDFEDERYLVQKRKLVSQP